jgi:hypothetical protein
VNLSAARIRIESLTRDLLRNWDDTRLSWRDAKAQEFEARYLSELASRVEKASAAIDKLDLLLNRIRGDCE